MSNATSPVEIMTSFESHLCIMVDKYYMGLRSW